MILRCVLIAVVGVALVPLVGSIGQLLLHARIEKDGKVVLEAMFGVPDTWDKRAAWRRLESQSFKKVGNFMPDPATPGQLTMKGKIRDYSYPRRPPIRQS